MNAKTIGMIFAVFLLTVPLLGLRRQRIFRQ